MTFFQERIILEILTSEWLQSVPEHFTTILVVRLPWYGHQLSFLFIFHVREQHPDFLKRYFKNIRFLLGLVSPLLVLKNHRKC